MGPSAAALEVDFLYVAQRIAAGIEFFDYSNALEGPVVEEVTAGLGPVGLLDEAHGEIRVEGLPAYPGTPEKLSGLVEVAGAALFCNRDLGLLSYAVTNLAMYKSEQSGQK